MTRYLGYIAMSLDGRIADGDGEIDWLLEFGQPEGGEADYGEFIAGIDALVMGRATYDYIVSHHDWSYGERPCFVVTSRPLGDAPKDVVAVPPDCPALKARIEAEAYSAVWIVGGGVVQRAAMDAGMFDRLRVFVMPVVVGSGPLLFSDGDTRRLKLENCRDWGGGIVELEYTFGAKG